MLILRVRHFVASICPYSTNIIRSMTTLRTLLACSLLTVGLSAHAATIEVHDAYVNAPPPVSKVAAGYFKLQNHSDKPRVLKSISSPVAGKVELHKTSEHNGQMRMRKMDELRIDPHSSVTLRPGGMHLMFMKLKKTISPGDNVAVSLHFANGDTVNADIAVRDMRSSDSDSHGGHGKHHSSDDTQHHHH